MFSCEEEEEEEKEEVKKKRPTLHIAPLPQPSLDKSSQSPHPPSYSHNDAPLFPESPRIVNGTADGK